MSTYLRSAAVGAGGDVDRQRALQEIIPSAEIENALSGPPRASVLASEG